MKPTRKKEQEPSGEAALGIAAVAARTGLSPPTLRMWEARFGHPSPLRSSNGRRCYSERDVDALCRVVRDREAGLSLQAAIRLAFGSAQESGTSIYAALRRDQPHLPIHRVAKRTLISMSHALEDEYCARSERALLFAAFQRASFYRQEEERWRTLASRAELAVVFADFKRSRTSNRRRAVEPLKVTVDRSHSLFREWAVICDGPVYSACLCGWELPGQSSTADSRRRFEVTWSVEPDVVRCASRIAWELALSARPELEKRAPERLDEPALPADEQLRGLTGLTNRMLSYMSEAAAQ